MNKKVPSALLWKWYTSRWRMQRYIVVVHWDTSRLIDWLIDLFLCYRLSGRSIDWLINRYWSLFFSSLFHVSLIGAAYFLVIFHAFLPRFCTKTVKIYPAFFKLYAAWYDDTNFKEVTSPRYGSPYSFPLNKLLPLLKRVQIKAYLHEVSPLACMDDVRESLQCDLKALSERLGPRPYFLDDVYVSDCHIFVSSSGVSPCAFLGQ